MFLFSQLLSSRRWKFPILLALLISFLVLSCNLPISSQSEHESVGLNLYDRSKDGAISGSFLYPANLGGTKIIFSVSNDGQASYQIEGASKTEILTVSMPDESSSNMVWNDVLLDGYGALSEAEQAAMFELSNSDLLLGLSLIPLDIACKEEDGIDPQQVAVLLFPLQLYFKYQVADRNATAFELISLSACPYSDQSESLKTQSSFIYLTPADPIPVVIGYFPFDAEGALEASSTGLSGWNQAVLNPSPPQNTNHLLAMISLVNSEYPRNNNNIRDQWGPCDAKCRGACGADCTLNNCSLSADYRCEVDGAGYNTGKISYVHIYDCGLHPACIKHDQCYDNCNLQYGCGSFKAFQCRHGGWSDGTNLPENYYCDKHTVSEESLSDVRAWVNGFGNKPVQQTFVYTDKNLAFLDDLENCPIPETISEEPSAPIIEELITTKSDLFTGEVIVNYQGTAPVWEIPDSYVEFQIEDDILFAVIEYTQRSTLRQGGEQNGICNVTFTNTFSWEGPMENPVLLEMVRQSYEIIAVEGTICEKGGEWKTSVREDLIASLERNSFFTLDGYFSDNDFEGVFGPASYKVIASKVD